MSLNRSSKRFLGCVAVVIGIPVLLLLYAIVWPPYYRQDTIRVRIVDSETKKPIQGVAVAAQWLTSSVPFGVSSVMRTDETTTNADGVFELRGWWKARPFLSYITDDDPEIWIYKYGYDSLKINNRPAYVPVVDIGSGWQPVRPIRDDQMAEKRPGWRWGGIRRFCFWNRKTIALKPTKTAEEEARALEGVSLIVDQRGTTNFSRVWDEGLHRLPLFVFENHRSLAFDRGIALPQEKKR